MKGATAESGSLSEYRHSRSSAMLILGMLTQIFFLCILMPAAALGGDFPYGRYEALLKRHVKTGATIDGIRCNVVDYAALKKESKRPESDYSMLLKELTGFDPAALKNREERIAFWINVYNIGAIKTIVDHYPVGSIRSRKINWLGLPWSRKAIDVGGRGYSLARIENDILLDGFRELRIHFGINCASVSCVDLLPVPYRAETLYAQLEAQGRAFLADRRKGLLIVRDNKVLYLSQVFKFDKKHFDTLGGGAIAFIRPYLNPADRVSIDAGGFEVEYLDYNWNSNDSRNALKENHTER